MMWKKQIDLRSDIVNFVKRRNRVIYFDDLMEAIQSLPDSPNGYSGTYDKATIINMVEDLPKHYKQYTVIKD